MLSFLRLNSSCSSTPPKKTLKTTEPNRRGQPLRGPGRRLCAPELCDPGRGRGGGSAAGSGCGASRRSRRRSREKSFDRGGKQLCRSQAPFRAALRDRRLGRRGPGGDGRPASRLRPGRGLVRARGGRDGESLGGGGGGGGNDGGSSGAAEERRRRRRSSNSRPSPLDDEGSSSRRPVLPASPADRQAL